MLQTKIDMYDLIYTHVLCQSLACMCVLCGHDRGVSDRLVGDVEGSHLRARDVDLCWR